MIFPFRPNPEKNNFLFHKIQNIYLIFKTFGSATHNFILDFVKFQKKSNNPIQRKCPDRCTDLQSVGLTFITHISLLHTPKAVVVLSKGPQTSATLVQSVYLSDIAPFKMK